MPNQIFPPDECTGNKADSAFESIPMLVKALIHSYQKDDSFSHLGPAPIPSQEVLVTMLHQVRRILFPGYFAHYTLNRANLEYYMGQETTELFEQLSQQILLASRHDCLRYGRPCFHCVETSRHTALKFLQGLPEIRRILGADIRAALSGDPAAKSYDEIIFSYPGLFAITIYRVAHLLLQLGVPLLPRMMSEYAHRFTGIDIHPGAKIGESFFIDHGTGVVIGETAEIGNQVRLYQGVTLGALSLPRNAAEKYRHRKRHPTIEDEVIIYANTTILGGETVIGSRSIIGGNIWLTESVPPDTKVILKKPELIFSENHIRNWMTVA